MNQGVMLTYLSPLLDVAIVYYLVYRGLLIIKGTRAVPMLVGLVGIALLYLLSKDSILGLSTFNWLLENFIGSIFLVVVVLFQAEIRRGLAAVGRTQLLSGSGGGEGAHVVDELVKGSSALARHGIGALIVVERTADLSPYTRECTKVDAKVSKELLHSIFVPERQNPLHDGAVMIRDGRIDSAGVFLPMSVRPHIDRALGTRHRAALGISEQTDALVIVVSEERGTVSLAYEGALTLDLSEVVLRKQLTAILLRRASPRLFRRDKSVVTLLRGIRKDEDDGETP